MGTRVSVGSVDISLESGRGTVRDLVVANPEGFSREEMFRLAEITVDVDVKSLNKDPIVIDEVTVSAPQVRVEMNAQAQTNVGKVKSAVDQYQSASAPKERKQDSGFEKRFVIRRFVFEEGTVEVDATAMEVDAVDAELPPVRLSDVGGARGDTPDGIGKTVSRAFLGAVGNVVAQQVQARAAEAAKQKASDAAKKALGKLLD
jgi:uncharacterized protein involved in outer membrane biogenesis